MHLILDGISGNDTFLRSRELVKKWLVETTKAVGASPIATPRVSEYISRIPEESGISGDILLTTSSITIHTWPNLACVCIDIFSCKDFDVKAMVDSIVKELGIVKHGWAMIDRPLSMDLAVPFAQHVMLHHSQA